MVIEKCRHVLFVPIITEKSSENFSWWTNDDFKVTVKIKVVTILLLEYRDQNVWVNIFCGKNLDQNISKIYPDQDIQISNISIRGSVWDQRNVPLSFVNLQPICKLSYIHKL